MTKQLEFAKEWLFYAGQDVQASNILYREKIYVQTCFHAHQCVEKTMKAFLVLHGQRIPKTHDLLVLFEDSLVLDQNLFKSFEDQMMTLNLFYIPTRYPDAIPGSLPHRLPNRSDAKEALTTAEEVYAVISQAIHGTK
ncbi:MAG: HEPN domain-containing protein [Deltaproteobacteria bacterium]|nr:HEPN domain-containing protein [Deltaproteobacteria bacterium]